MLFIQDKPDGLVFKVFIQPRSSQNIITGLHGDALKIKITAPPVDSAANKMCLDFLAKRLKVAKSSLGIISGHRSRTKLIMLKDKTAGKEKLKQVIHSFSAF